MYKRLFWIPILLVSQFYFSCNSDADKKQEPQHTTEAVVLKEPQEQGSTGFINPEGTILKDRILVPNGYKREDVAENSFAYYLQTLPMKPQDAKVHLYNGELKYNQHVHAAIIDLDVGKRDLQQCADAVMRLRGEYLFAQKQYDQISFNFTNGFKVEYKEWMKGKRMVVKGNKTYWSQQAQPSNSYKSFRKYLTLIYSYAGTLSLAKELKKVPIESIEIGDVFIQGGSPGHAVTVLDVAKHESSGEKIFLLAQSYMPAQDIHVLVNPDNSTMSPWYSIPDGNVVATPEWTFYTSDLKRFP